MKAVEEPARQSEIEPIRGNPGEPRGGVSNAPSPSRDVVVLVDASNVAYGSTSPGATPSLKSLLKVLNDIRKPGRQVIALADASLRHKIDRKEEFEGLLADGVVTQVPAGTSADDFLWQLWKSHRAKGTRAVIVTNDRFPIDRAREDGITENPRIAVLPLGDEVIFQPAIEEVASVPSLRNGARLTEPVATGPQPGSGRSESVELAGQRPDATLTGSIDVTENSHHPSAERLVGAAMRVIASMTEPMGGRVRRINFAGVALALHRDFNGDFVKRFSLRRPRDLAQLLSERGLVTLSFVNATMYLEPTQKFEEQASGLVRHQRADVAEHRQAPPVKEVAPEAGSPTVGRHPTSQPDVIEVSAGAPSPTVEISSPDVFLRLAKDHQAMHIFHWPSGVYKDSFHARNRRGGEFFYTSEGTSYRLFARGYRTLTDFLDAQSHGFAGADDRLRAEGEERQDGWGGTAYRLPDVWYEVQRFSKFERDEFPPLEGDVYYCARDSGFVDLSDFLRDRKEKERSRPRYV